MLTKYFRRGTMLLYGIDPSFASDRVIGKEAKVYLALLQLGRTTAYSVAVLSALKRPTTYLILDELVKSGFVVEIPSAVKKLYEAKPPEEIFALAKERVKLAESALPNLQSIVKKKRGKTQTLYFEGLLGLEQALIYKMPDIHDKEAVGFYAAAEGATDEALTITNRWLDECKRKNIRMRGFVPKNKFLAPFHKKDKESGRVFRSLPASVYSSHVSLDTIEDFVRIIDIVSPIPQATIIENAEVAKMLRQIFERLWLAEKAG